jgi:hypothetical protein
MAVYVDKQRNPFGRMIMCHMIADTPKELHDMARSIGMRASWFQRHASFPHYDLSLTRRAMAVKKGAIEVERRDLVEAMRRIRASGAFLSDQVNETGPTASGRRVEAGRD